MSKKKIAIVIAMNDIQNFHGGSRNGIKKKIDYFDQFLVLYESIVLNWEKKKFDYDIYVLHSLSFNLEREKILKRLNLTLVSVVYPKHKVKIRPMCYKVPIDCDYRLVLDVDMYALKEPNFNFQYDIQAMYGGNKYTKKQWKKICDFLDCDMPKESVRCFGTGAYKNWTFSEHYKYQSGKSKKKRFPYFNNGAILIKNSLCSEFLSKWEDYRKGYTDFILREYQINIDLEGQDVIGLALYNTSRNWGVFDRGMNLIIQDKFKLGLKLIREFNNEIFLLHYIHMTETNKFYGLIKQAHSLVKEKYYK